MASKVPDANRETEASLLSPCRSEAAIAVRGVVCISGIASSDHLGMVRHDSLRLSELIGCDARISDWARCSVGDTDRGAGITKLAT